MGRTLYDKIWDEHVVHVEEDGTAVLYIDRHLVHEVTSPQAFEGLRETGRKLWRVSSVVATADHNTPTTGWELGYDGIADPISKEQITTLNSNIAEFGSAAFFPFMSQRQGIVHVVGPENGATLPGMTVVCGDSHTSTHGAFGALAHGIGTSEVEHVMATQTLLAKKARNMLVKVDGECAPGVGAKDIVLAIIGKIGTAGGTGHVIEYAGDAIRALDMAGRMTSSVVSGTQRAAISIPALGSLVAEPMYLFVDSKIVAHIGTHELAALAQQHQTGQVPVQGLGYADLQGQVFDVVFNATSASLVSELPPLPNTVFGEDCLAYELAYGKGLTPFLLLAQRAGVTRLADGVGMLAEQAAEAFLWWRGVRPNTAGVIQTLTVPLV